jgi:hypothetical protein
MTNSELTVDISNKENELISLKQFELTNLKNVFNYLNECDEKISFTLNINKNDADKHNITVFNIKDCMDTEIQEGLKKVLKIGISKAIKKRETFLTAFNDLIQ